MDSETVSLFISHKVADHARAARRMAEILEGRTESLTVQLCEEIDAGDSFRDWINTQIKSARTMIALLPPGATRDTNWMSYEIGIFQSRPGRLFVLKHPADPNPSILGELELINATKSDIRDKLLEPLLSHDNFIAPDIKALNPRVSAADLDRDAQEIKDAFDGVLATSSEIIGASLTLQIAQPSGNSLDNARISTSPDFDQILDWRPSAGASWKDLKDRALLQKGKGTFWAEEMEGLMADIGQEEDAHKILTSTFRGRGTDTVGKIFRPTLNRVDYVDNKPVCFNFIFEEVLVPELIRPRGALGEVMDLLYIAIRMRSEVLYPFLLKRIESEGPPDKWQMSQDEQRKLIGCVIGSLRSIELQVERHHTFDAAISAFPQTAWEQVAAMLNERPRIIEAINIAGQSQDFLKLITELKRAVDFNCRAMPLLTQRFNELMAEDTVHIGNVTAWESTAKSTS